MTVVVNNSPKVIHIGGTMLAPGVPCDVDDEHLNNDVVKAMFDEDVPGSDGKKVLSKGTLPAQEHPQGGAPGHTGDHPQGGAPGQQPQPQPKK